MYEKDIELAKQARLNAYSPYSNFLVGACLRCKDGSIYLGCNVENGGIQSICAERTAFVKALSEGKREFTSIAIVGAPLNEEPQEKCLSCGYCRQFISEFVDDNFKFILEDKGKILVYTLNDFLPHRFDFKN